MPSFICLSLFSTVQLLDHDSFPTPDQDFVQPASDAYVRVRAPVFWCLLSTPLKHAVVCPHLLLISGIRTPHVVCRQRPSKAVQTPCLGSGLCNLASLPRLKRMYTTVGRITNVRTRCVCVCCVRARTRDRIGRATACIQHSHEQPISGTRSMGCCRVETI